MLITSPTLLGLPGKFNTFTAKILPKGSEKITAPSLLALPQSAKVSAVIAEQFYYHGQMIIWPYMQIITKGWNNAINIFKVWPHIKIISKADSNSKWLTRIWNNIKISLKIRE